MTLDYIILTGVWILSFILIFVIPRNKIKIATIAFLFKQAITWPLGLMVVEFGLLDYPVRFFAEFNRSSITYEFLAYPIMCAVFVSRYPGQRNRWLQLGYYVAFCTFLTIGEVLIEKYTDLIRYFQWHWYWTWISLFITFWMTKLFCDWFFRGIRSRHY